MKILVLNPPFFKRFSRPQRSPAVTKSGTIYFPIWLAYCAGVLEEAGHQVFLIDAPARGINLRGTLNQAERLRPEMIVMDTSTPSIRNDIKVGEEIREMFPDTFIVMVGIHASALSEETLQESDAINAIARREYEYTVRDLASILEQEQGHSDREARLRGVAGLSFRAGSRIIHNADRDQIHNLDELPWVSKVYANHLSIADYFNPNALYPMVTLITSRGCPFRCSFCVYPQVLTGRKYRFRNIGDVVDEIEYVVQEFPEAKSIFFEDDTLTANKKRCMDFADSIIRRGIRISWQANSRVDLDLETMKKMKTAGCRELCVGFESSDQDVLNSMKKGIKLKRMFQFMKDARTAGILIHGCFMVGFPGETRKSCEDTIDLAIKLNPDTVQFYPVMVYPGTEAYEEYKERGWLTANDYTQWITPGGLHNCVVRNETLTSEDLVRLCDQGRRKFYLRPRYLLYKLCQMLKRPSEVIRTAKASRTFFKHLILGSGV